MTLEEAIKVLQEILSWQAPDDLPKQGRALELGIKAMERLANCRELPCDYAEVRLQGETRE